MTQARYNIGELVEYIEPKTNKSWLMKIISKPRLECWFAIIPKGFYYNGELTPLKKEGEIFKPCPEEPKIPITNIEEENLHNLNSQRIDLSCLTG